MLTAPVVAAVLAPLVAWRVYSRIKRLTTRQHSRTWRHRTTLVFFPLLLALVLLGAYGNPVSLVAMAAGAVVGIGLGTVSLKKTVFEQVDAKFYFTPHAPIGAVVALLFIARMGWRAYEFYVNGGSFTNHEFMKSPVTLLVFGILAAYYMTYAVGLLRWRKRTAVAEVQ
ncbi:MAG TPA: hypothetical protein VNT33_11110 [Telluria sp.]|nr:hypothetical protein [Telluria sp.]